MISIVDNSSHLFIPRLPTVAFNRFTDIPRDITALVAGYLNLEQRESLYQFQEGAVVLTDPARAPELSKSLLFHHKIVTEVEKRFADPLTFDVTEAEQAYGRGFPMGSLHPENLSSLNRRLLLTEQVDTSLERHTPKGFTDEVATIVSIISLMP